MTKRFVLCVLVAASLGCGQSEGGDDEETATVAGQSVDGISYFSDVKPILDAYCVDCHVTGGAAPFALDSYDSAKSYGGIAQTAVNNKTMPPWGAEAGHQAYRYDNSLSEAQIELFNRWVDEGMAMGQEAMEGQALSLEAPPVPRADVELTMPTSYTPSRDKPDDYRCFVLEWPETADGYITAFNALPTNNASVHHMVAYLIPPYEAVIVDRFDDLHEGPGYSCYGGATPDDWEPAIEGASLLYYMVGQWAPGLGAAVMPANSGQPIAPGSRIVLQMHYSTLATGDLTDQSSVQFQFDEEVETPGYYLPWFNFEWFANPEKMLIPAGEEEVWHSYQAEFTSAGLENMTDGADFSQGAMLHTLFPHMHRLGQKISLSKVQNDESETLINLPAYDFDWQREYLLKDAISLMPGDDIRIDCMWDNTHDARLQNGVEPADPVDVAWGEGTVDEMCIAMLYVTAIAQ